MLQLLRSDPGAFAIAVVVLLYSLVLHELAHAVAADRAGDDTARNLGRITLDPLKHLELMGTAMLLFIGFGWAKPVPIRIDKFRHFRRGLFTVSIAGVVVNFGLAVLALIGLRLLLAQGADVNSPLVRGLVFAARINVLLAVFNLLPIPPLDGSKVLSALSPAPIQRALFSLERYGFLLVIGLLVLFRGPIFGLVNTITSWLANVILA